MNEHSVSSPEQWPVVIVGAGPAGLTAAVTLGRAGVDCLVVDRHAAPAPLPKATVVSTRSMELFRSWRLHDALAAGGNDVEWQMLATTTLADAANGQLIDVGYPTKSQSRAVSPTGPACVPQDHLERVLVDHLPSLPNAHVRRSVALIRLRHSAEGYQLSLRDEVTAATWDIGADYVIGADGAHSTVRTELGIPMPETAPLAVAQTAVFHAPLWDIAGPHRYGIYAIEVSAAAGTLLPAGPGDRWLYAFESTDTVSPATFVDRIRAATGRSDLDIRLGPRGSFTFIAALADRFRHDNAFLVGDAAHRVTPRGGTGMNTAIADGFDLGWKLAWVLNGWSHPALLDTYETERRPVAEHQVQRSIDPLGSRRSIDELHVDLGGRLRHIWLPSEPPRSTLDLLGTGITLLHTGTPPPPSCHLPPLTAHRLDPLTARSLGILPGQHLLLRPDGLPMQPSTTLQATQQEPFAQPGP